MELLTAFKSIVYRVYSFVILCGIAYYFTGNIKGTIQISTGIEIVKLIQYYIYELLWGKYVNK